MFVCDAAQNTSPSEKPQDVSGKVFCPQWWHLKLIMFGLVSENYSVLCQVGEYKKMFCLFVRKQILMAID